MFIYINTWMIRKNPVKNCYLESKICMIIKTWKTLLIQITDTPKEFGIKDLRKYHDVYVRCDTALLLNVF